MQYLVLFTICVIMTASYFVKVFSAPRIVEFVPEMISVVVAVYVVLAGIRNRFELVRTRYWLVCGGVVIVIVCGVLANSVGSGPVIAGMRWYLRAIPFFFLPAVFSFSEGQIRQQLHFLTGFAALQLPTAVYQRYVGIRTGHTTGDTVFGTLVQSGILTTFLLGAICVVLALTVRRQISKRVGIILFLVFVIPTTVNETKITFFLLPLAVIMTMVVSSPRGNKLRVLGIASVLITIAGAIFIPVYDYLGSQNVGTKEQYKIMDMFTQKDWFKKYLDTEAEVGSNKEVGRVDAITVPLEYISRDPVSVAFGLGVGNASTSSLGSQFTGNYGGLLALYSSGTTGGALILEFGLLGTACVLLLQWMIFSDSLKLSRETTGLVGALTSAWPAVVLIAVVAQFYTATYFFASVSYLFWFYSGLIAARRTKALLSSRSERSRQRTTQSRANEFAQTELVGRTRTSPAIGKRSL